MFSTISRWDTFVLFHLYGNKGVSLPLWPSRQRWFHTFCPCAEPLGDGHEGMWSLFGSQGSIAFNWHLRYSGTRYSGTWLYLENFLGEQAGKLALANASENLAGQMENGPGQVEFCIGYIRYYPVWASAKIFSFPAWRARKTLVKQSPGPKTLAGLYLWKQWIRWQAPHSPGSPVVKLWVAFNSLRPSDAYMRQSTMPSLVQIMACRLVGAKPLSEPMLEYC